MKLQRSLQYFFSQTISKGDIFQIKKIFIKDDIDKFSKIVHDFNPIHFNEEYAKQTVFKGCIVHGMLTSSLFSGLIGTNFPGSIYISQSLKFLAPVYLDEEVRGIVEILEIKPRKQKNQITLRTQVFKANQIIAIDGTAEIIL